MYTNCYDANGSDIFIDPNKGLDFPAFEERLRKSQDYLDNVEWEKREDTDSGDFV